jgi:hypothetical protein
MSRIARQGSVGVAVTLRRRTHGTAAIDRETGPDPPWGWGVHWTGAVLLGGEQAQPMAYLRVKIEEAAALAVSSIVSPNPTPTGRKSGAPIWPWRRSAGVRHCGCRRAVVQRAVDIDRPRSLQVWRTGPSAWRRILSGEFGAPWGSGPAPGSLPPWTKAARDHALVGVVVACDG